MRMNFLVLALAVGAFAALIRPVQATELYFLPDSSSGLIEDTVSISAWITSSDTMRGFTIYMGYDTNKVELAAVPVPGTLISGRSGLDFRYSDHIVSNPNWLEVGATIFGTSFWAGPGELFRLRMVFRGCGDVPMIASFGMRRPDGTYVPSEFNPPVFMICDRVPNEPDSLTILWINTAAILRWKAVTLDTLGRVLFTPPLYRISRSEELPATLPFTIIDSTFGTTYSDSLATGLEHLYYIQAVGQ